MVPTNNLFSSYYYYSPHTHQASECLWNSAVANGYAKSIPRGEILIFAGAMAVLGYSFRSAAPLSKTINSILQ